MKKDEAGKTRKFIKNGLILWIIIIGIYILLKFLINTYGSVEVEEGPSGFFDKLIGILFIFGVCGIPIILLLSILLKFAERIIDKIGNNKDQEK